MKILISKSKLWLGSVVGVLCALNSVESWAACTPKSAAKTISISVPSTLTIPRDTPIGAEVYRTSSVSLSSAPEFTCSTSANAGYRSVGTTAPTGPSPIGNSGFGWRMIEDNVIVPPYPNGQALAAKENYYFNTGGIILYKMGDVSTLNAGTLGAFVAGGTDIFYFALSNAITPRVPSCTSPSINVPLGRQFSSKFKGVGSTIGELAFSIKLNNCPAGINSISYRLDPVTTPVSAQNGILALDPGGATGVGIKITDDNGAAVGLGVTRDFLKNVSEGNYTIPLKAAYYKTSDTVVGGAANAAIQFTITYQ